MLEQLLAMKQYGIGARREETVRENDGRVVSAESGSFPPFSETLFTQLLCLERKRAERSRKPFALMLIEAGKLLKSDRAKSVLGRLAVALPLATRETDIWGWHTKGTVIGAILTEIGSIDTSVLRNTMHSKVTSALQGQFAPNEIEGIQISIYLFPEDTGSYDGRSADIRLHLYPDLQRETTQKKAAHIIKRVVDVSGSLTALILLSPLLLGIALAIKLTSKGPMLFTQKRVGQYGVAFTFLKFRSMYFKNDPKIHQEYVKRLIVGKDDCEQADGKGSSYKLTGDPRITPLGGFLRRTSLDELPQFFNVLRGEMSLVGPRPPIPYETEVYDIWHRRRYFEAKPGITGLWQVRGRSRVKFDDMVRLDIQYTREWSLGLDLRILLETPRAVLFGKGAR